MSNHHKAVCIVWVDSSQQNGWIATDEVCHETTQVRSVGFLINETEEFYLICDSYTDEHFNNPLMIPKETVKAFNECEIDYIKTRLQDIKDMD